MKVKMFIYVFRERIWLKLKQNSVLFIKLLFFKNRVYTWCRLKPLLKIKLKLIKAKNMNGNLINGQGTYAAW